MKISSKQITNSIIWNKNNNNKQNKQPSLPVARPALSSSSPSRIFYYDSQSMNILFLLVVDYCYIAFTYRVSYMEYSWKWFHEKTLKFSWKWFHEKKFEAIVDLLKYPHPFWTPCKYVSDFCRAPQKQNKHNSILADQQQSYMMTKWYINYKYPFLKNIISPIFYPYTNNWKKNSVKSQSHTRRNFGKKIIFFSPKTK